MSASRKAAQEGLTIERRGGAFAVFENGVRIGSWTSEGRADVRLRRIERERRSQQRACLCCGAQFESEGIGNRLCNPCRSRREFTGV